MLCQLEFAQDSRAHSSNLVKVKRHKKQCWCFIQNMRKRLKVQIIDHRRWHSKPWFLSYPAKCLLKAFARVACNNCFLLLQSTPQWLRQRHDASEHFLSLGLHTPTCTTSRWKQVCLLNWNGSKKVSCKLSWIIQQVLIPLVQDCIISKMNNITHLLASASIKWYK